MPAPFFFRCGIRSLILKYPLFSAIASGPSDTPSYPSVDLRGGQYPLSVAKRAEKSDI